MKRLLAVLASITLVACGGSSKGSSSSSSTGSHGSSSGSSASSSSSTGTTTAGSTASSTSAGTSGSTASSTTGSTTSSSTASSTTGTDSGSTSSGSTSAATSGSSTSAGSDTGSSSGSTGTAGTDSGSTSAGTTGTTGTDSGSTSAGTTGTDSGSTSGGATSTDSGSTSGGTTGTDSGSTTGGGTTGGNTTGTTGAGSTTGPALVYYNVGGQVSGLGADGLVLQNNSADDLPVAATATSFAFPTALLDGSAYAVTVLAQPAGEFCAVSNGSGNLSGHDVTDVQVTCQLLAPTVLDINPAQNASEVSEAIAQIDVAFDEPMNPSASTLSFDGGRAADGGSLGAVDTGAGAFWANNDTTLSLPVTSPLRRGHDYVLDLTGTVGLNGLALNGAPVLGDGKLHFHTIVKHAEPVIDLNALLTDDGGVSYAQYSNQGHEPANDTVGTCQPSNSGDLVFRYTVPAAAQQLVVDLGGSVLPGAANDTVLYAYAANQEAELGCDDDNGSTPLTSKLTINRCFQPGDVVHFVVDTVGANATWGNGHVNFAVSAVAPSVDPTLTAQSPAPGATGVSTDTSISVTFATALDRTAGGTMTINSTSGTQTIDLAQPSGATVAYTNGNKTVTVTPTTPFVLADVVTVSVNGMFFTDCLKTAVPAAGWTFYVRTTPPPPAVSSIAAALLPTGFVPGLGLWLDNGNLYFTITNSTSNSSIGTKRGGIGYVPATGGTYTPVYTENQVASLDPQAIFFSQGSLYAYNGMFSSPQGTGGLYQVTSPTSAVQKSTSNSGSKYGYSVNGDNFFVAQFTPSPFEIFGANSQSASAVAMTNVTPSGSFSGPYGVAVSAQKVYVFDTSLYSFDLATAVSPAVPTASNSVNLGSSSTVGGSLCQFSSTHVATALDKPSNPTRLFYTSWGSSDSASGNATNRICVLNLDASGTPVGPATVYAGPTTTSAAAGSADAATDRNAATFEKISALYFDSATGNLYVLQRLNSVTAKYVIRVIAP